MTLPDEPIKVVHVIDELPPDGAERLLVDILKYGSSAFRYSVVCLVRGGALVTELEAIGVPVTVLGRRSRFDPSLVVRLVHWLRNQRPSVLHTHLFTADAWGRTAGRFARVPAIFSTVHSTNMWKGEMHRWIDRVLARHSTCVIACSKEVGETLVVHDHLPRDRVVVVPNGIDLKRFQNVDAGGVRKQLGIAATLPVLVVVGRLHEAKGHADLLAALDLIRSETPDFQCLFVGSGELREPLEADVTRRGLIGRVRFLGQRRDVPQLLAASDVMVIPSRWEGLPIALLEAMAMEKAIVATAVGGIPDVVEDGGHGLIVAPGDIPALGRAIRRLLVDAEFRQRLGRAAGERVRQRYDVAATASAYENLYRTALAQQGALTG